MRIIIRNTFIAGVLLAVRGSHYHKWVQSATVISPSPRDSATSDDIIFKWSKKMTIPLSDPFHFYRGSLHLFQVREV
jgi:hypothetical protein